MYKKFNVFCSENSEVISMSINEKVSNYVTFPKTFESYAWYKPIIVFILATIIMFVIGGLMSIAASIVFGLDFLRFVFGGGIDGLNSAMPIIFTDLFIFMFVPGLILHQKLLKTGHFLHMHLQGADGISNFI